MKLVFAFVCVLLIQTVYPRVVKKLDTEDDKVHIHNFVPHKQYKRHNSEANEPGTDSNVVYNLKKEIERLNERVDSLVTKEQRHSNEDAYRVRYPSRQTNNRPAARENTDYNNPNERKQAYTSEEKRSKLTHEYNNDVNNERTGDWNRDNNRYDASTNSYMSSTNKYQTTKKENQNSESNNGLVVIYGNKTGDQIVFPGKVNVSTPKTCPQGLVMAANGDCLEPIVIHMGNRTSSEELASLASSASVERGYPRSFFTAGCLKGYSRTFDGQCEEIIYD